MQHLSGSKNDLCNHLQLLWHSPRYYCRKQCFDFFLKINILDLFQCNLNADFHILLTGEVPQNDDSQCSYAKYQDDKSLITNLMTCNSTTLNNICVKTTPACTGLDASTELLNRQKRSAQVDNSEEPYFRAADDGNPLDMIFHPSKKEEYESFLHEAKKEYEDKFSGLDMQKSYDSLFELLWYTQMPCFDTGDFNTNAENRNGMIKSCSWKGIRMPCSKLFKASPTDRGMCCSFNVDAANQMFKSSKYKDRILKMQ